MARPEEAAGAQEEDNSAEPCLGSRCKVRTRSGRLRHAIIVDVEDEVLTVAYEGYPPKFNEQLGSEDSGRLHEVLPRRANERMPSGASLEMRIKSMMQSNPRSNQSILQMILDHHSWRPVGRQETMDWIKAAMIVVATLVLNFFKHGLFQNCSGFHDEFLDYYFPAWLNRLRFITYLCLVNLQTPIVVTLLLKAPSHYLHSVANYAAIIWVATFSTAAYDSYACSGRNHETGAVVFQVLTGLGLLGGLAQVVRLLAMALAGLEKSLLRSVGARRIRMVLWAIVILLFITSVLGTLSVMVEQPFYLRRLIGVCAWADLALTLLYVSLNIRALHLARGLAMAVEREAGGRVMVEAQSAKNVATEQLFGVTFCLFTTLLVLMGTLFSAPEGYAWPLEVDMGNAMTYLAIALVPGWIDTVANMVGAIVLFQGAFRGGLSERRKEAWRRKRRSDVTREYSSGRRREHADWDGKVSELADRGFSMRQLLKFYRGLGSEYMEHFEPSVHTTEDVARQAIIPLSSSQRCAYAEIMMGHVPTRPNKMVTHNWSNLFRDLVAGIIADALGEDEYKMVAALLDVDIDEIETWLTLSGELDKTYWVCAFSVSQHDSICGANPLGKVDPVTGQLHPTCNCGKKKYFNDNPPLTADGRSIACEMNKFDDMMGFLAAADPAFEQVIVVDVDFVLFSRAWCIAEIVKAYNMGMRHHLKLESMESLKMHRANLRNIRVEDMNASRQEDVDEILSKIQCKAQFNTDLQLLIFETILPKWQNLDVKEKMVQIGRLGRWGSLPDDKARIVFSP